jgi:hypothetical protein
MKYRPDESTLISWMYGELDETERSKVEGWFNENPAELQRIQQMQSVRDVMSNAADKEVIAPPVVVDHGPQVVPIWRTSYFRISMSIAASFLLIIVAGKLLGPEISYKNNELKISFASGKSEEKIIPQNIVDPSANQDNNQLTQAEIQEMINASLRSTEERIDKRLTANQAKLDKTVRTALASAPLEMDSLANRLSEASEIQVRAFVTTLRDENLTMMRQYLELSSTEQRAYMENLLVDFSKWQQEQRNQDLQVLLTRVNSIEHNTNQLKEETEQILASIISNSGASQKQSN